MEVLELNIGDIRPYENNPRKNDDAVDAVANSIQQFGFKVPIVIDKHNVIVCGHTRYKASIKLGLKKVPCVIADDLSDEQIKAFRLADNKTNELAEWDMDMLMQELSTIDMDMSEFGFVDDMIDTDYTQTQDDDYEIKEVKNPKSKPGDIYLLGRHRLMCGDSTNHDDVQKLMNEQLCDLLLTDPPYNVAVKNSKCMKIENDDLEESEFREFLTSAFKNAYEILKPGSSFYIWYAIMEHIAFEESLNNAGLFVRQVLIWNKSSLVLGRSDYQWKHEPCLYGWKDGASHNWYSDRRQTTVLDFNKPQKDGDHPTMKPIDLLSYQIGNSSKKNDIVTDLFGGSGSTLIACEQMDRTCYMMEYDPKYVDVIIDRWETFTGKKAHKVNDMNG